MEITLKKLKEMDACSKGRRYFVVHHKSGVELVELLEENIKTQNWEILKYANWLIVRCMTLEQCANYAMYAMELACCKNIYFNDPYIKKYLWVIESFKNRKMTKKQLLNIFHDMTCSETGDIYYAFYCAIATVAAFYKKERSIKNSYFAVQYAASSLPIEEDRITMITDVLQYGIIMLKGKNNE
jgi:hypothetical protein